MKHINTPVTCTHDHPTATGIGYIRDAEGDELAVIYRDDVKACGKEIEQRINLHEQLVEALQALESFVGRYPDDENTTVLEIARAALAKLEG